jgi:glycerol kinase
MLMNLETLQWDKRLCKFFNIPQDILPKIRSNSEIFGYIKIDGKMDGIPIASCISNNNSALIGQLCLKAGQIECHIENDSSIMLNTGQQIIHSENDLITTVGFQLGPNEKPFYALEGFVGSSVSSIDWLKNSISPLESNNNNSAGDDNSSPVSSFIGTKNGMDCFKKLYSDEVVFVPALKGLCAPSFLYQAKGFLSGLSIHTNTQDLFTAAKTSICFQTKTILESIRKDCKAWQMSKLVVGGDFAENADFLQLLSDLCSITVERPQISSPITLGTMLSAAITMKCLTLDDFKNSHMPPKDNFYPTISSDKSNERYVNWLSTFKKSLFINETTHREEVDLLLEEKTAHQFILNSLPGCLYLFSSYVIYVLSQQVLEA